MSRRRTAPNQIPPSTWYLTGILSQPVRHVAPETIKLRGGALSLDFANSVDWTEDRAMVEGTDALIELDSLDRWGTRLGVAGAPGGPAELARARALREALHGIFSALAHGGEPDLAVVHDVYAEAVAAATLTLSGLDWPRSEPRRVRFAVAADAVALITDPGRAARLHRCPGRDCGWVFLDTSGRRRWCSMDTCGSREKMRRMYARRKAAT
jgi:predicted RNA-binding Zn ribbon-like protein